MGSVVYRRAKRMEHPVTVAWLDATPEREEAANPQSGCSCRCMHRAISDFTHNSTLHGLRYVADQSISRVERLFWIISFAMACGFAANFISNVYYKWTTSPVIMSLSPQATWINTIPFPAVTICNMNNARKSVARDILQRAELTGSEGSKERKMLNDFCKRPQHTADGVIEEADIDWSDLRSFMVNVSQPCHEMLISCSWHGMKFKCEDIFNPSLTDEGICCSFNKVKRGLIFHNPRDLSDLNVTFPYESIDWTPEKGYPAGSDVDWLPWRAYGAGSHLGLSIVLDSSLDDYYCSSEVSKGFKVVLHNSVETPKMSGFASLLAPGMETRMLVEPVIYSATEQFQRIPQQKRNCIFADERNLSFYRTYTQRNCVQECEAQFTLAACKCVVFHMPKNETTRICGREDKACADNAIKAMELRLIDDGSIAASLNTTKAESCGCRPGCFAISYKKTISTSKLTSKQDDISPDYLGKHNASYFSTNMAVLHIFFPDTQYTAYQRGELFGFTELLSNTGGLLGLFMGFSFLSAVEAVYFLTLRLWCSLHRNRDKTSPMISKPKKGKTPYPFTQ